jgi:hypothetical protein
MNDISIQTENGLNDCDIDLVQHIEKELTKVMVRNGFTKTTTTKADDKLIFNYRQFGKAL